MKKIAWRTAWQGQEIVVFGNDLEVDRLHAPSIERVVLVHRGSGDSPGDLLRALVETETDWLLFPAETGFAGRVNFERQQFWADRACVFWVTASQAPLPLRLRRGAWFLPFDTPTFLRLPRAELNRWIERWPLQGPQTWDQRKWRRIEDKRPFGPAGDTGLRA